jgi:hypothetical protein
MGSMRLVRFRYDYAWDEMTISYGAPGWDWGFRVRVGDLDRSGVQGMIEQIREVIDGRLSEVTK